MSKKKTHEQWVIDARAIHGDRYEYPGVYNGNKTPIEIVCSDHGIFPQLPNSHLKGRGCPKCSGKNKPTQDEWIEKVREVHGYKYNYPGIYVKNSTPIDIECKVTGHGIFPQLPSNHLSGSGCPKCSFNIPTQDEWIEKARKVHGDRYEYPGIYVKNSTLIDIECKVPGHGIFPQLLSVHLSGCGCPKCGGTYIPTQEEWVEKARKAHGDRYKYPGIYVNNKNLIDIECKVPGHGIFPQTPNNHLSGSSCPICSPSGFNKSKPGILYYLKIKSRAHGYIFKIGITNYTVEDRYVKWEMDLIEDYMVLHKSDDGAEIYDREQALLKYHHLFKLKNKDDCPLLSGWTECFGYDPLHIWKK